MRRMERTEKPAKPKRQTPEDEILEARRYYRDNRTDPLNGYTRGQIVKKLVNGENINHVS